MRMLTNVQYRLLKLISPGDPPYMSGGAYRCKSKVRVLLGDQVLEALRGKVIVDFGCGEGDDAISLAQNGAHRVIGIDNRQSVLEKARAKARERGVETICSFCTEIDEKADAVVSLDCFEHFTDPPSVLLKMYELLNWEGSVFATFGPTWYHPLGATFSQSSHGLI
jgi:2-polyprenyl-3-methyl-5-hydroxy-6-metoxy-1,4-benzoquinol methylase